MGRSKEPALHAVLAETEFLSMQDQLYRYAEDLQAMIERQRRLEAENALLRERCGPNCRTIPSQKDVFPEPLPAADASASAPDACCREAQFEVQASSMLFQIASEGVMITSTEGDILAVNPAFTRITGYDADEVIGRNPGMLGSGMSDPAFQDELVRALHETGCWKGEVSNRRKNGGIYPAWLTVNAAHDPAGRVCGYIGVFSDLSGILQTERRLTYLAHHDMLTGLPNRLLFQDRLEQQVAQSQRTGTPFSLIFIDLDRFKQVNDSLGHEIGDIVLKEAAARLSTAVRQVDTVARLGGDEFVIIAPGLDTPEGLGIVCHKVIHALGEAIEIDGHELFIGGSLGCASYPLHAGDEVLLLKYADNAMYQAKATGGNTYVIHDPRAVPESSPLNLEAELRHALPRKQLRLDYQPLVAADGEALLGVEALLRWQHPTLGPIPPETFVALAERTGLIIPLGAWVIDTACMQLASWDRAGLNIPTLIVNISSRQLRDADLVPTLQAALENHGLEARRLQIDVSESALLRVADNTPDKLAALRELGVGIAIDDFGTGHSCLSRLMNLPADCIKLDRGLVAALEGEASAPAAVITEAVIHMSEALGIRLLAKGVETEMQHDLLLRQGCPAVQGHLTGRPMAVPDMTRWLKQRQPT